MYGGAAAAEAARFSLPPPEELATHVDWPTWQLYLRALADLLQRDDIEQVRCCQVSNLKADAKMRSGRS